VGRVTTVSARFCTTGQPLLPGATTATTTASTASTGETTSSTTRAARWGESTGKSRLKADESVLGRSAPISVMAVPIEVGGVMQLFWCMQTGLLQHLLGNAERDPVDQELIPQGK